MYENLFFFFWKAIQIAGSAQKIRVGQVSGNTDILLGLNVLCGTHEHKRIE